MKTIKNNSQEGNKFERLRFLESPNILYNYITMYVMGGIFLITGIILFFLDLTKIETRFILFPILTIEKILYWPIYYGIILLLTLNFLKAGTKLKRTKPIHGARKIFKIIAIISSACLYLLSVIYIIFYEINLYFITFLGENMFSGILFIIGPTTFSFFCILFLSLLLTTVLEAAEKERRKRVNKKPLVLMLIIFLIFFYAFYEFFIVYGLSGIGEGNLGYMVSRIVLCVLFCIIGTILLVMKRKWRSQEKFNPESNGIWN